MALVAVPPRFTKTTTICAGVARNLCFDPASLSAAVSAGRDQSLSMSVKTRAYVHTFGHRTKGGAALWHLNGFDEGGLFSVGAEGQYFGKGTTGVQVIDDPYGTSGKALSSTVRRKIADWEEGTAANRCEPGSSRIICHTRFHLDDLIGHKTRTEGHKWKHVKLPAVIGYNHDAAKSELYKIAQLANVLRALVEVHVGKGKVVPEELQGVPDHLLFARLEGFGVKLPESLRPDLDSIGKSLWPEYWPMHTLLPFMRSEMWWWAMYMQEPRPIGTQLFRAPARFKLADFDWNMPGLRLCIGVDTAATESDPSDVELSGLSVESVPVPASVRFAVWVLALSSSDWPC